MSLALSDVAFVAVSALGHVAEAQINGTERERFGNDLYGAYGTTFTTSDGVVVYAVGISPKQWSGLLEATDATAAVAAIEAEHGVSFRDEGERFAHREAITAAIAPWVGAHSIDEVAARFERLQQATDLEVGLRDLGVVGADAGEREVLLHLRRSAVGGMRVIEVDPGEVGPAAVATGEPLERAVDHLAPRSLDRIHALCGLFGGEVELVDVVVEALRDAPARIEHEGGDEGGADGGGGSGPRPGG